MTRRLRAYLRAMALMALCLSPSLCDAKGWEAVRVDVSGLNSVAHDEGVEIRVAPGHVVVVASQQVQIKVFTILGQVVSDETLPAGTSRLPLSHGVYIVKVGDLTCKIAV
ncbi:MAG: T9SS type A sorting domain-containing protein [Bacteroides sp.]|nr:T9SS type A sorting domain-containing protein [Bacteroides sp.]MBD5263066.1 T9SS type A sorting domain-containing protein [Bacteroides sp.]